MDIEEYFKDAIRILDSLTDEEFEELLIKSGVEEGNKGSDKLKTCPTSKDDKTL